MASTRRASNINALLCCDSPRFQFHRTCSKFQEFLGVAVDILLLLTSVGRYLCTWCAIVSPPSRETSEQVSAPRQITHISQRGWGLFRSVSAVPSQSNKFIPSPSENSQIIGHIHNCYIKKLTSIYHFTLKGKKQSWPERLALCLLPSWRCSLIPVLTETVIQRCSLISPNRSPRRDYCRAPTEIQLGLGLGLGLM